MDISRLSDEDTGVIGRALRAAVDGPFFPEWEFQTLFGLSREELGAVADNWSGHLPESATAIAINNVLNNLCGYALSRTDELSRFGLDREQLATLLRKIRREPMDGIDADAFPSVEWPIVMIDGHDVGLFEESGDLQGALEPWMAYDEGFEFYDARGRRLRAFVALYGVDVMVGANASASDTDRVLEILKAYLQKMGQSPQVPTAALRRFMVNLKATRP